MANYRAHILSTEAAANGDVHVDTIVQREVTTGVWAEIPNGHRTLVLDGAAVLGLSGTVAQKRAGLLALFKAEVKAWGLDTSDAANVVVTTLVPAFPVDVAL